MTRRYLPTATILTILLPGAAIAGAVDYVREVKPILTARCLACHGALQQKGELRVDTVRFLREGGNNGPAVTPGKSAESLLIAHLTGVGGKRRMPPASEGEGLTAVQIELIRNWIDQGAISPADEKPEADPKDHWAFRTPSRPAVPAVKDTRQVRNAIDAFLQSEIEKHGLTPAAAADRRTWLRRVHLDLVGLPPTRQEQEAFLADQSPDAYTKVVERLLALPQYGERWGRHWMDIWRYSDWWGLGAEVRNSQKHIWHWRDWIIESLNADKGYEQMVREMLAADELYPNDLDRLRATGYLARQYFKFNRTTWLDSAVEHTAKGFLGLTLTCARCHDHKYDPITHLDYYRFRAFFEPYQIRTDLVPGEANFEKDGIPRAFDCNLAAPTYRFVRGDEKQPVKDRPVTPGLPRLLLADELTIESVSLPAEAHSPGLRPFVLETLLQQAEAQVSAARVALQQAKKEPDGANAKQGLSVEQVRAALTVAEKALAAAEVQIPALRARAAADRARSQTPADTAARELAAKAAQAEKQVVVATAEEALARVELEQLQAKANKNTAATQKHIAAVNALAAARKALANPGEAYTSLRGALKTLESNVEAEASRSKPFPTTSSGRRTALAKWITAPNNPLTARVAVNHIWARHFGRPLVPTVFDFGRKGTPPTHPHLLDWLAVEFMEHGWSQKHLHRLIVTSDAYRRTSSAAGAEANRAADAENHWYWRRNPVRMEAQVIRDSLLYLAGELDLKLGGPSVPVSETGSRRRSLYFVHSHNEHNKFLSTFDDADVLECYRRVESIVPQQALTLSNSGLALTAAGKLNERLHRELAEVSDTAFVRAAFAAVLSVAPTAAEQQECESALASWKELLTGQADASRRARRNLVLALVNHNDFITIR